MNIEGFTKWTPPEKIEPGFTRFWPKHLPVDAVVDIIFEGCDCPVIGVYASEVFWGVSEGGSTVTHYRLSEEGRGVKPMAATTDNKYHREIKPHVYIDMYDVLKAFRVTCPALQHLIKKALAAGERGHKSKLQDLDDIIDSAIRARELAK
jgi:hypothetical protein